MTEMLTPIIWDVDPVIFQIAGFEIRWYGVLYALGFFIGFYWMQSMLKRENENKDLADSMLIYLMLASLIGARLGHVFFYDWKFYSANPEEIIKIWHGGLASHGGVIGVFIGLWLFSKYESHKNIFWAIDRIAPLTGIAGAFIRLGNLMNSEIFGVPTDLPWGFVYLRAAPQFSPVPRHPTQIYEALFYLIVALILFWVYYQTNKKDKPGHLTGMFLTLVFSGRFFIEFLKENQEAFEQHLPLNMGQLLSIPLVILGLYLWFRPWPVAKIATRDETPQ